MIVAVIDSAQVSAQRHPEAGRRHWGKGASEGSPVSVLGHGAGKDGRTPERHAGPPVPLGVPLLLHSLWALPFHGNSEGLVFALNRPPP